MMRRKRYLMRMFVADGEAVALATTGSPGNGPACELKLIRIGCQIGGLGEATKIDFCTRAAIT